MWREDYNNRRDYEGWSALSDIYGLTIAIFEQRCTSAISDIYERFDRRSIPNERNRHLRIRIPGSGVKWPHWPAHLGYFDGRKIAIRNDYQLRSRCVPWQCIWNVVYARLT